jgi:hypothetical protein
MHAAVGYPRERLRAQRLVAQLSARLGFAFLHRLPPAR